MVELGDVATGIGLAKEAWGLLNYLRSIGNDDIISAYFSHDGQRIAGSLLLEIELHKNQQNGEVWFYQVKPRDGYVFLREPVNPSCAHELVGQEAGEKNPDSRFWRWVAPVLPGRIYGGQEPPNLKVDFVVFGYRPVALIEQGRRKGS